MKARWVRARTLTLLHPGSYPSPSPGLTATRFAPRLALHCQPALQASGMPLETLATPLRERGRQRARLNSAVPSPSGEGARRAGEGKWFVPHYAATELPI